MTDTDKTKKPSLLQPESRGGDTADRGFAFQENVILHYIPLWLSHSGFTAMVREAMGDTEVKFFVPGRGYEIKLLEVKNHILSPAEFRAEITRFRALHDGDPTTYYSFTLVSAGISKAIAPLTHGLRRVRDPYPFYEDGSQIKSASFDDYVEIANKCGFTNDEAQFLFEKVLIRPDFNPAQSYGEALFKSSLDQHLPEYQDLPSRVQGDIHRNLAQLVKGRLNQPITRQELENALREPIEAKDHPPLRPILIDTAVNDTDETPLALQFEWAPFFGGAVRSYPPSEEWNQRLIGELRETKDWTTQYYTTRRIRLTGNRRLSASLAIGSVFSAVAGFSVEIEYRSEIWATDAHPSPEVPEYTLQPNLIQGAGDHLVVSVGILRDIVSEVESGLGQLGLTDATRLHIKGDAPITSSHQANAVVSKIKQLISNALTHHGLKQIHLFFAGPAFLALFLGHRLSATAPVQCYEHVSVGHYVPTCLLS